VPGQSLAAALQTLPNAETAAADSMEATIEVPPVGLVRVTAKRAKAKHGKQPHYFWTPEKAVLTWLRYKMSYRLRI
jgi:hypothetical protein